MPTREAVYAKGTEGYKAMVADFTAMFDWDGVEESPADNTSAYTEFKKLCGGESYLAFRITNAGENYGPRINSVVCNGVSTLVDAYNANVYIQYAAYAYGNGFFAFCISGSPMPSSSVPRSGGISTCRNILTGETSWLTFVKNHANYTRENDYAVFSKDVKENNYVTLSGLSTGAQVGAAIPIHCPATGWVSDKATYLLSIPDDYKSCIAQIIFNGVRYIRLGSLLVPAE